MATINDFIDLIRRPLNEAAENLLRDIESAARKGQGGAAIQAAIKLGKSCVDNNVLTTFRELRRVESKIEATEPKQLRDVTVQELENFLLRVKAIVGDAKRHARGAAGAVRVVDEALQAMDRDLKLKISQFDNDLLDLGAPGWGEARWGEGRFADAKPRDVTNPTMGSGRVSKVDLGRLDDPPTAVVDLGNITDPPTESIDFGTIGSNGSVHNSGVLVTLDGGGSPECSGSIWMHRLRHSLPKTDRINKLD